MINIIYKYAHFISGAILICCIAFMENVFSFTNEVRDDYMLRSINELSAERNKGAETTNIDYEGIYVLRNLTLANVEKVFRKSWASSNREVLHYRIHLKKKAFLFADMDTLAMLSDELKYDGCRLLNAMNVDMVTFNVIASYTLGGVSFSYYDSKCDD